MDIIRSNHCVYITHYHIVFPVKYRKALLKKEVRDTIQEIVMEIGERYKIEFERLGCDRNHIHILCSFHPNYSIGETVRKFESLTAKELFKRMPKLKKEQWGGESWSDGYYAATVGEGGNWNVVEQYVKNQGVELSQVQLTLW